VIFNLVWSQFKPTLLCRTNALATCSGGASVSVARGHRLFWRLPLPLEVGALEVGPLNPARRSGERYELLSGVWANDFAVNDFDAFLRPRNVTDDT